MLFLDEFTAFRRDAVEGLRQPIEDGRTAFPERMIRETQVFEFGPVTFPAYEGASAGVRSLTDWYRSGERAERPRLWSPARRRERLVQI